MSVSELIITLLVGYLFVGFLLNIILYQETLLYGKWISSQNTSEAESAALIICTVFWGVLLPISIVTPIWRGLKFLGRGFRELMPERKSKLPEARIHEK